MEGCRRAGDFQSGRGVVSTEAARVPHGKGNKALSEGVTRDSDCVKRLLLVASAHGATLSLKL
jgi:hypothetical protein